MNFKTVVTKLLDVNDIGFATGNTHLSRDNVVKNEAFLQDIYHKADAKFYYLLNRHARLNSNHDNQWELVLECLGDQIFFIAVLLNTLLNMVDSENIIRL
ncbi:hypothetical protein [Facilibium subflavum]|uniref:hypothetical protein n=1 Tax=Facilibium subflavum TaxID=2219058 RepID=UPI000E65BC6E|nr:hypothetical protein [Facilibium subflavum]